MHGYTRFGRDSQLSQTRKECRRDLHKIVSWLANLHFILLMNSTFTALQSGVANTLHTNCIKKCRSTNLYTYLYIHGIVYNYGTSIFETWRNYLKLNRAKDCFIYVCFVCWLHTNYLNTLFEYTVWMKRLLPWLPIPTQLEIPKVHGS